MEQTRQDNMEEKETIQEQQTAETAEETKDIKQLESEIEKLRSECDDLRDKYQRTFSDFNNFKKRMVSARAEAIKEGQCDIIEKMLPVLDSFESALSHIDESEDTSPVAEGTKMLHRQMWEVLEKVGVKKIPALGEAFDPNLHQAVQMVDPKEGEQSGTVAEVLRTGYMQADRVIRHSMVVVNK